jgi:hypothetical protein
MHELIVLDADLNTPEKQALLKSLDAALVPSEAKPGSIESLIDALVHIRSTNLPLYGIDSDPRYVHLVEAGFEAVPNLIEHLDDDRLTRLYESFRTFRHLRVRDIVGQLLIELAGDGLPRDWIEDQDKASARAWWERTKRLGEEPYVVAHVLTKKSEMPNYHLLWLLERRYPHRLPGLYLNVLDRRTELDSGALADAVARSKLPREQMVELLIHGARHESKTHRRHAFDAIASLDNELYVEIVSKILNELPRTPKETYWRCPEQAVVSLVLRTEDARVWKALDNAARSVCRPTHAALEACRRK